MSKRKQFVPLYKDIRALVLLARQTVARSVDLLQVHTNYEIGRRIFEQEQHGADRAEYGGEIIRELAAMLGEEFGSGFSLSNLKYMRQFYLAYRGRIPQIGQTTSGQSAHADTQAQTALTLSWSHYVFVMGLKEAERKFYELKAAQLGSTLSELKRQFNAGLYERLALSRDKKSVRDLERKGQHVAKPQDLRKEPYVLEFLGLQEKASYTESELESAIVTSTSKTFFSNLARAFSLRRGRSV